MPGLSVSGLLLRGARLVSPDGLAWPDKTGATEPCDIRIHDGAITAVAPALSADRTERVVDLGGRWVVPGLWDNHVHFSQWAMERRRVDVSGASSAEEAAQTMRRALDSTTAPPSPLVGVGFRDGLWPDAPTRQLLDRYTGEVPAVIIAGDLHGVWLNSAALALYDRPEHPTGVFSEHDAFEITGRVNTAEDRDLDQWADEAGRQAAARGVVGIVDLEMAWNLDTWRRRITAGSTSLRVEFGIYTEHLPRAIDLGLRTGQQIGELLTVGPYKVITDGSLNTRTAYCFDAYGVGEERGHGILNVPPDELLPLMRSAAEAGITPAVHAIGDLANRLALDVFEQLGCGGRIEHAQLLSEPDTARFARLGVIASVQPEHAMDDRDVADLFWPDSTDRTFPLASLLASGARLMFGSDAPVAPLDPWVTMAAAVTRARDGRSPWHPEQRIPVGAALAASTRSAVAVGQPADLAVLDAAPADPQNLRGMPVAATLLGGRFTHDRL